MLTQGPTPDLKCKLNISSFLTLTHLLDCLMPIVLLLQMVDGWERCGSGGWGVWLIYNRVWERGQGAGIIL